MAAAAAPTATVATVATPRKTSRSSAALAKLRESGAKALKNSRDKLNQVKGKKPVKMGRAALAGGAAGAIHSMVALNVGGRTVPVALVAGLAGAALTDNATLVNDAAIDMISAGSALFIVDEWKRQGWAKR